MKIGGLKGKTLLRALCLRSIRWSVVYLVCFGEKNPRTQYI